jgi:glycyl-tRNA synthetase beta chain
MVMDKSLRVGVYQLIRFAYDAFEGVALEPYEALKEKLRPFFQERVVGLLEAEGNPSDIVIAVFSSPTIESWSEIPQRLSAVAAFKALPESAALAAANKRIGNILKKSEAAQGQVNAALLHEAAEQALFAAMQSMVPQADALYATKDYSASLQALAALRAPVDAFFDGVMVNADDPALKANRLALLQQLHSAMNRVADLSKLAA